MRPGLALTYLGEAIKDTAEAHDWATANPNEHPAVKRNRRAAMFADRAADRAEEAVAELRRIAKAHRGEV